MYRNKKVLVTGGMGMIGMELIDLLNDAGANVVIADKKLGDDLTDFKTCLEFCEDTDYIFHLAGVKGSARMTHEKPSSFMTPMLRFDTNMIEAARQSNIERFLYTSSIAVLNQDLDKFPAWAKYTGEMLLQANKIEYNMKSCIVRPSNVYGLHDDFKNPNSMVITSLIRKALEDRVISIYGDGTEERDFIHARDVAKGMMKTLEVMPSEPINLCSGKTYTIDDIAGIIMNYTDVTIKYENASYPSSKLRKMESNGNLINWKPEISIDEGIKEIICRRR